MLFPTQPLFTPAFISDEKQKMKLYCVFYIYNTYSNDSTKKPLQGSVTGV